MKLQWRQSVLILGIVLSEFSLFGSDFLGSIVQK